VCICCLSQSSPAASEGIASSLHFELHGCVHGVRVPPLVPRFCAAHNRPLLKTSRIACKPPYAFPNGGRDTLTAPLANVFDRTLNIVRDRSANSDLLRPSFSRIGDVPCAFHMQSRSSER
jgi:hypothetical protein